MKRVLAAVLLGAASAALAEPVIHSPQECIVYSDLALVAATLAKHGIAREMTDSMLPDMYTLKTDDARELARRIVDRAYVPSSVEPRVFATGFATACLSTGGHVEALLGTRL